MRRTTLKAMLARPRTPPPAAEDGSLAKRRRRPRSKDESEALMLCACARHRLWVASGKLEIISDRRWRFHPGEEKILSYLGIAEDD